MEYFQLSQQGYDNRSHHAVPEHGEGALEKAVIEQHGVWYSAFTTVLQCGEALMQYLDLLFSPG